jgi:hypothetical protein
MVGKPPTIVKIERFRKSIFINNLVMVSKHVLHVSEHILRVSEHVPM